ncbi:MAG: VIT1/CCC1 transporter family protein [Candidatus Pacearchaeota archaeon]|nr:VIT1/CCC1 transporter family protein [Candidatus Pacearchaeota archaeon]
MDNTKQILEKYSKKFESELSSFSPKESSEYSRFKEEMVHKLSSYERWAKSLGNLITIKVAEKDRIRIQKYLDIAHLDVTPSQALTLSALSMFSVFFATVLISIALYLIYPQASNILLFAFLGTIASLFIFYYTYSMPQRLANAWRLKASSQMVPAVLYVVVYMKHTSNLEKAIEFASQHLEGPLALDFKKIFYDVEIGKFSTIKDSLESYLESWRDYAPEFIESFHLIESSLFEPSESRRIEILEKSLQVILDGVYEKMLKYSREIRSPLTNVYMLGIILPTLALALLPLASTLLGGIIRFPHIFVIFNIIIPFFVYYLTSEILLKRPGGYGETSVLELNPEYEKFISKKPLFIAFLIVFPLIIIGISPYISHFIFNKDFTPLSFNIELAQDMKFFDFKKINNSTIGPFGPIAAILSLFIPLSIALFFSIAYTQKTKPLIKTREDTKILEEEFTNSLFQLGNRLGDGIPAEIAFAKVAESTKGQKTEGFFALVNQNIQQLGMSVERAIFDSRRGAIIYYPSALISTSMRILIEAVKKGLQVAARSLMSISDYIKNIQKINQRLRDLLAEVISDMKSNMTFLAPLLAGIVVGLSTMITIILNKLQTMQAAAASGEAIAGFGNIADITRLFDVTQMIPPYHLQIVIGIYLIEIIFILTSALVTVDSGKDPLKEKAILASNLKTGILLYTIVSFISILLLTLLAAIALSGM